MSSFDEFITAVKAQDLETVKNGLRNEEISVSAHDKSNKCTLEYAIDSADTILLQVLLESGRFKLDEGNCCVDDLENLTPVLYAASTGQIDCVKIFLQLKNEENINMQGIYFAAARSGHLNLVKWLLTAELVDPNCRNLDGANVLSCAIRHEEVFNYLIDVVKVDYKNVCAECECTLCLFAASRGQVNILKRLISEGEDFDKPNEHGFTPLYSAIIKEKVEAAKFLIEQGADIGIVDKRGYSILDIALEAESEEFLKALDLGKNIARIPEIVLFDAAKIITYRNCEEAKSRFIKYVLPLMPEHFFTEGIFDFSKLIFTANLDSVEPVIKLLLQKSLDHQDLISDYFDTAVKSESSAMIKELVRVCEVYARDKLTPEVEKGIFHKCLLQSLLASKLDFLDYFVSEKGVSLEGVIVESLPDEFLVDYLLSKNYTFPEALLPQIKELKKKLEVFESEEAAKPFDAAKIDNELVSLEGDDFKRKLRFFLLDAIESQHFKAVKHILSKWKPSVAASDYLSYPVNVAAKVGHFGIFKALCEYGFSVNVFDADETDAFVLAVKAKHHRISSYILARGLHHCYKLQSVDEFSFPFILSYARDEELAIILLKFCIFLPLSYSQYSGATILHLAAQANMPKLFESIKKEHPKLEFTPDNYGRLPCHDAFAGRSFEVVAKNIGLYKFLAVSILDAMEKTPLEYALGKNYHEFINKLKQIWPKISCFMEEGEKGTFKDLYAKHKPALCICGLLESPQWKCLNAGICKSCNQTCNPDDSVNIFPCGHLAHDSCIDTESLECPDCRVGFMIFRIKDEEENNIAISVTNQLLKQYGP